jgi:hypothetical protein
MPDDDAFARFGQDFEAIEAAVLETARGRWFLGEFTRRNRNADTGVLLEAIRRLEVTVAGPGGGDGLSGPGQDGLAAMSEAIERARSEIAVLGSPEDTSGPVTPTSEVFARIVRTTERATSDILDATERMQEAAWTLRERGVDTDICDELDGRATQIYTACAFQDLTAQRMAKILDALRIIETHLSDMVGPAQARLATHSPMPLAGESLSQNDIDFVIVDRAAVPERANDAGQPVPSSAPPELRHVSPAAVAHPRRLPGPLPASLAAIDALSIRERLKLFT